MSRGFEIDVAVTRRSLRGEAFELNARLSVADGITVVFGPSGSGKTTMLMAVLGDARPERGRVVVGDRVLFDSEAGIDEPVHRRRIGVVFQDALLFPHLSARDNAAFGLPGSRVERRAAAERLLEMVGASALAGRLPAELSRGQRQRVALARALAPRPDALLLDEPFSALDETSREDLGRTLVQLQLDSGVPFLYVTHDVGEAMRLGQRLALLDGGVIVQTGTPAEVFSSPASAGAARAVGTENLFSGTVEEHVREAGYTVIDLGGTLVETGLLPEPPGSRVALGLRAEDVLLSTSAITGTSARNVIAGTVASVEPRGGAIEIRVDTPVAFRVLVTPEAAHELGLGPGAPVHLLIKAHAFKRLL